MGKHGAVGVTQEQAESFVNLLLFAERPCITANPADSSAAHALLKMFSRQSSRRIELRIDPCVQEGRIYAIDRAAVDAAKSRFVIAEPQDISEGARGLEYSFCIIEEAAFVPPPRRTFLEQIKEWMRDKLV